MDLERVKGYTEARELVAYKLQASIENYETQLKHIKDLRDEMLDALGEQTEAFLKSGIGFMPYKLKEKFAEVDASLRAYYKGLASNLGKPGIIAEEEQVHVYLPEEVNWKWVKYVSLTVPNTKRMEPIVSALVLVSGEVNDNLQAIPTAYKSPLPVHRVQRNGYWQFLFTKDTGRAFYDSFVQRCATDPVFRVILRNM